MSRLDDIAAELRAYLTELDEERHRARLVLTSVESALSRSASDAAPAFDSATTTVTRALDKAPGGGDAFALRLMQEHQQVQAWTPASLLSALEESGWETHAKNRTNAAGAILSRLRRSGQIVTAGRGRYSVRPPTNAESPASTGPSVVPAPTEEGRTDDVAEARDHNDHIPGWNDSDGRGTAVLGTDL